MGHKVHFGVVSRERFIQASIPSGSELYPSHNAKSPRQSVAHIGRLWADRMGVSHWTAAEPQSVEMESRELADAFRHSLNPMAAANCFLSRLDLSPCACAKMVLSNQP